MSFLTDIKETIAMTIFAVPAAVTVTTTHAIVYSYCFLRSAPLPLKEGLSACDFRVFRARALEIEP